MLERGRISSTEIIWMVMGFIMGSSVLLAPALGSKQMAWMVILAAMAEGGFLLWSYTSLCLRFPGQNLIEILIRTWGRWVGGLVAALYVLYFAHLGSLVVRNFVDFIRFTILTNTPNGVIFLIAIVVLSYAAFAGIEAFGRSCQLLMMLTFILFFALSFMLATQINYDYYLPLFHIPWRDLLWSTHATAMFPFGEVVLFMMIFPYLERRCDLRKGAFLGYCGGGILLALTSLRALGVLGPTTELFVYPFFYVARLVNLGNVLTRMEIIVAINLLMLAFIKIGVCIYASTLSYAQLFRLSSYQPYVLPFTVLIFGLSIMDFSNIVQNIEFANRIYPIYAPLFSIVFPLALHATAVLRKLSGPQEES